MPSNQGHISTEAMVQEVEEPPDNSLHSVAGPPLDATFTKSQPVRQQVVRRESLLTRQLHASEGDSHTEDETSHSWQYTRAPSTSSVAELTSDNDLTSPGTRGSSPSPPLIPHRPEGFIPILEKHIPKEPVILEQDESTYKTSEETEKKVETGLGRRRCITFACGKKSDPAPQLAIQVPVQPAVEIKEPPKRKSMITFNCPMRTKSSSIKTLSTQHNGRHMSPAPKSPLRSPRAYRHRGSDSTLTNASPVSVRKAPTSKQRQSKYLDAEDEDKLEAKRFHEFAVDANADQDWIEEATCHRNRMTINDTLKKENAIRQIGKEVEDEAEEDEDDTEEYDNDEEDDLDDDLDLDEDDDEAAVADDAISDGGFDTDDEEGFANSSDSENDDSDFEWWAPGRSTTATSTEYIEHIRPTVRRKASDSSLESAREANGVTVETRRKHRSGTAPVQIERTPVPELPDSTDFVCGTLDEDRPLEQAYKLCMESRKAAKHRVTPQDIDPTFPTSDPELEEDDEEDEVDVVDDATDGLTAGKMELHDDRGRRDSTKAQCKKKRSPSPAPGHQVITNGRIVHRSPPPGPRRTSMRSPPPPIGRTRHRSPPPRKLFASSPQPQPSIKKTNQPESPPNSRKSSPSGTPRASKLMFGNGIGVRHGTSNQATSLPRVPTLNNMQMMPSDYPDEDDDDDTRRPPRIRGAIDIVKGLERKRQRRKEKLYQKHCQKVKKEGERKPKPGKGAERMRELGLELAAYRGKKAEHMLSI